MKILHSLIGRCTIAIVILVSALSFCFSTFALNITKSSLSVYDKSDGVIINSTDAIDVDNTITPNITFSQLGDYITYKFTLNNDDDSTYRITSITDNNTNANITSSYSYDDSTSKSDKDIYITLTYANELTSELSLTNFETTINYEEVAPTDDDTPTDNTDDIEDIVIPNTSSGIDDGPNSTNGTSSPDTGSQTFSKTLNLNTNTQNNILPIVLSILLACIVAGILYLVLRKIYSRAGFTLAKFAHSRQALHATISLVVVALLVTGGVIGITHAADNNNLVLSFDLSKIQVVVNPTGTRTAQFIANSSDIIIDTASTTTSCDLYFNRPTCEVTLPSFTATSGYEALGWSTDASAHEALYQSGDTVSISTDTVFYTITRKSLLASFVNQHDTYFTTSKDSDSCYIYNAETSCQVTTPTASKVSPTSGSEFLGWSTSSSSLTPEASAGATYGISENTAMYSVVSIPTTTITISFIKNDPSGVTSISETTKSCTMIDEESSCNIIIPDFTVAPGYTKIGWNSNSNANLAEYLPGQEVSFQASATYYTISKTTFTASFINQHTDYFTTSASSVSCDAYNGATSCLVTTPTATATTLGQTKEATFLGWSSNSEATSASYSTGEPMAITNGAQFYSVVDIPPTYYSYEVYFINQDPTGISQISQSSTTCTLLESETDCTITLPTITAAPGYEALGWSKTSSTTTATYSAGSTVTVSESTTFYTVSRTSLTATFTNLHPEYFSTSTSSASCYLYNGSTNGCTLSTPSITKLTSDPDTTFLGWNTDSTTQSGMESGSSITIHSNATYYSIAKIPTGTTYSMGFRNIMQTASGDPISYFPTTDNCLSYSDDSNAYCVEIEKSCTVYTWDTSCTIKAPDFNTASGWDAYGYDTIYPGAFYSDSDKTADFVEYQKNITVTASNNGKSYFNITQSHDQITASFINQHAQYNIVSSASSRSCHTYNGNNYCPTVAPDLVQQGNNYNITKLAWSISPSRYNKEIPPLGEINITNNATYYSGASGIPYTITFSENANFGGINGQNNIIADALSLYQADCAVTNSGCYLSISDVPRVYSTGNTPDGFFDGYGFAINNLLDCDFIANTTIYAKVYNWNNIPSSFSSTKKIYQPGSTTEYYAVDFETGLNQSLVPQYGDYIESIFNNAPQLFVLRGKMRFLTPETLEQYHPEMPNALMITLGTGLYSPIDASPYDSDSFDPITKSALVHELGHAIDSAWQDLYNNKDLTQQDPIKTLYSTYLEQYNEYIENHGYYMENDTVPLDSYAYKNIKEFFAQAFTVWFGNKSGFEIDSSFGYITPDISETIDSYLCNAKYDKLPYIDSAPVCNATNN